MPFFGIFYLGLLLSLNFFVSSCRSVKPQIDHLAEANRLVGKGDQSLSEKKYERAVAYYDRALFHATNLLPDSDLSVKIKGLIKKTKAKSLIDHYQSPTKYNHSDNQQILPATLESNEFTISQYFGEVNLNRVWTPKKITALDKKIGLGRKVTLLSDAGLEVHSNPYSLRAIGPAGFSLDDAQTLFITSGIYFISGRSDLQSPLVIEYPIGKIAIINPGDYAFFLEVTTNGGCKVIGLVGEPFFALQNQKLQLKPGELVFVMSNEFSRKMNIELSTFIASSHLMTHFQEPPSFAKKLKQNALIQAIRTKKHFRVMVGDAKNEKDFEIKILNDSPSKE